MKIGFFSSKYPYKNFDDNKSYPFGGSVLASYYLCQSISKQGVDVEIFTTSNTKKNSVENHDSLTIYRYGSNFNFLTSNFSIKLLLYPLFHNVDIVHVSHDIPPMPIAGYLYSKIKKIPLIVTYHGDWDESYGGIFRRIVVSLFNKYYVDKLLAHAKVIISPSKTYIEKSRFLKKYHSKIIVIANGINIQDFYCIYSKNECRRMLDLPEKDKIILFLGYITPYKGPDILIKAFKKIIDQIPNAVLIFAGKGPMQEELKTLVVKMGLNNVHFHGYIEEKMKPIYYRASDIFVLPSRESTECYPLTILESMAIGTPIVASNAGGIPDAIIDKKTGFLVSPNDDTELANTIINLLNDSVLSNNITSNAISFVKEFNWENIAQKTVLSYFKLHNELNSKKEHE